MQDTSLTVGEQRDGEFHLRGTPLSTLIRSADPVGGMWLAWTGQLPSDPVRRVLAACLAACIDHGSEPPSSMVAEIVASCGKPLADSVAGGLLTLGARHGNACSAASALFRDLYSRPEDLERELQIAIEEKRKLPGFGHPVYETDPRTSALLDVARTELGSVPHCDLALTMATTLARFKGKPLPLNVDGALGAIIADLDALPELADALFLCGRTFGLVAHALIGGLSERYQRGK